MAAYVWTPVCNRRDVRVVSTDHTERCLVAKRLLGELTVAMDPLEASLVSMLLAPLPAALIALCLRSRLLFLFAICGSVIGQVLLSPLVTAEFVPEATVRDRIILHAVIDLPYATTGALLVGLFGWWMDPNLRKRWPFKKQRPKVGN